MGSYIQSAWVTALTVFQMNHFQEICYTSTGTHFRSIHTSARSNTPFTAWFKYRKI